MRMLKLFEQAGMPAYWGSGIRNRFRCTVVFTYATTEGSGPGAMSYPSIMREPGNAAASSSPRTPEAGRFGNISPDGIGSASVLLFATHDAPSPAT